VLDLLLVSNHALSQSQSQVRVGLYQARVDAQLNQLGLPWVIVSEELIALCVIAFPSIVIVDLFSELLLV
jgi:hypothetical protein